jgi:putative effector of murein hydrolase LrgA (UPF0299 family)
MTLRRLREFAKNQTLRLIAILLIVLIAGPEIGIALDLTILLDIVGAELFLLSFIVGIRMMPWRFIVDRVVTFLYRIDPYFFIPSARQIRQCPPIAVHAVPCFVALCLVMALWGTVRGST